jgi:hypothetical protein
MRLWLLSTTGSGRKLISPQADVTIELATSGLITMDGMLKAL